MSKFNILEIQRHAIAFLKIRDSRDIAQLLNQLRGEMFKLAANPEYNRFTVPKRKGGMRTITTPNSRLMDVQQRLNTYLQCVYYGLKPASVHGFVISCKDSTDRWNILSNAQMHTNKSHILNIDLKDYFQGISASRVRQLFMSSPFEFSLELATCLALLTTYQKILPTGAPTSPVIANLVTRGLDKKLAKINNPTYTRYADDLTFSSDSYIEESLGKQIEEIILSEGFIANPQKVWYRSKASRQTVTGLVVNNGPSVGRKYIRQLRAILHNWETKGLEESWKRFYDDPYSVKKVSSNNFIKTIEGRINFVGQVMGQTYAYANLRWKFERLTWMPSPEF